METINRLRDEYPITFHGIKIMLSGIFLGVTHVITRPINEGFSFFVTVCLSLFIGQLWGNLDRSFEKYKLDH